jgi:hypothetical protein
MALPPESRRFREWGRTSMHGRLLNSNVRPSRSVLFRAERSVAPSHRRGGDVLVGQYIPINIQNQHYLDNKLLMVQLP